MPRRLRYQVAVSLDGFIAGPDNDADWIVADPSIDFAALFADFDTVVMGRKTHEAMAAQGSKGGMPGLDVFAFSRTLPASSRKGFHIVNDDPREVVAALKAQPGRDIWLFGGGSLCRSLLDAGLVDTVEVAVIPVLLGAGVPLVAPGARTRLVLTDHKTLPDSGIMAMAYSVEGTTGAPPRIGYVRATSTKPRKKMRSAAARPARSRAAPSRKGTKRA
jgi:dihydrofolate reductase